jgi:hypothetical protein
MELFFRRRWIGEGLHEKILPSILNILRACTTGLDHLSLIKGDHYCAEVVKGDIKYCSCLEW